MAMPPTSLGSWSTICCTKYSLKARGIEQSVYLIVMMIMMMIMMIFALFWFESFWSVERDTVRSTAVVTRLDADTTLPSLSKSFCPLPPVCSPTTDRRNILWYNYGDHAGLDDRRQVLWTLSNLAASLCGRVVVPPPWQLLDPDRHGTEVSPGLRWDDLIRVTDASTNHSVVHEMKQPMMEFASNKYNDYRRLTTRRPIQFYRDYEELRGRMMLQHTKDQQRDSAPFLWEVKVSWHQVKKDGWPNLTPSHGTSNVSNDTAIDSINGNSTTFPSVFVDSQLQPTPAGGCLWIQPLGVPDEMKGVVDSVWKDVVQPWTAKTTPTTTVPAVVGFLHIRRGDSVDQCDTSLPTMESYLYCSLRSLSSSQERKRPYKLLLLLASDERDVEYRQGIATIVNQLGMDIELIDLDDLVRRHVQPLPNALHTNYYVYAVEWELKRHYVNFVMERRHGRLLCHDCEDFARVLD